MMIIRSTLDNKELIVLSIATSIDALAVGVSFAFLSINVIPICLAIGVITFLMCFMGVLIGKKIGNVFKNYAQIDRWTYFNFNRYKYIK